MVGKIEESGVFKCLEDGMRGLKLGGRIIFEEWFEIYELEDCQSMKSAQVGGRSYWDRWAVFRGLWLGWWESCRRCHCVRFLGIVALPSKPTKNDLQGIWSTTSADELLLYLRSAENLSLHIEGLYFHEKEETGITYLVR